jgi:hypothetical protein
VLRNLPVDFLYGALMAEAIFLLQEADEFIKFAPDLIQILVSELSPRHFDLAAHLLPLTLEYISVHRATSFALDQANGASGASLKQLCC